MKDSLRSQATEAEHKWLINFTLASFDSVKGSRKLGQGLAEAREREHSRGGMSGAAYIFNPSSQKRE